MKRIKYINRQSLQYCVINGKREREREDHLECGHFIFKHALVGDAKLIVIVASECALHLFAFNFQLHLEMISS